MFGSAGDFAKAFKEAYACEAPYQAAELAAAVHVYADAFRRAQSLIRESTRRDRRDRARYPLWPREVRRGGTHIAKPMVLSQVLHGKYVVVASAQWATEKPVIQVLPTENGGLCADRSKLVKAGRRCDLLAAPHIERLFLGGGLERVAGVDRRRARTRCLLEQSASLLGLGCIGKGPGDQPPLLVGREHAAWLKPGDEGAMIGEELAPERAQRIRLATVPITVP